MLEILDGRKQFYQWDLNQKIKVNDSKINELHFANCFSREALVCVVKDGVADVPNILLQEAAAINVYGYCGECFTRTEAVFKVLPREKPADYVYTETEIKNWEDISNRVDNLENNDAELNGKIEQLGEKIDYLEKWNTSQGSAIGVLQNKTPIVIYDLDLSVEEIENIIKNCVNNNRLLVLADAQNHTKICTRIYKNGSGNKEKLNFNYLTLGATGLLTVTCCSYIISTAEKTVKHYKLQLQE